MSIFEQASRSALRFSTPKGVLTADDLWHLPLQSRNGQANLDDLAKSLNERLKETTSFVNTEVQPDDTTQLAFDIVRRVIEVRLAEAAAAKDRAIKLQKKARIAEILAEKEDEHLKGKSADELRELLKSL